MSKTNLLLSAVLLSLVGYYLYLHFRPVEKPDKENKEHFENSQDEVIATFYSFDYCGYCKQFKPVWNKVKSMNLGNVQFRQYEANTLSDEEKQAIPYYVECKYAPVVILTVNGKNIEFEQQSEEPNRGLDVFITSNGTKYYNANSEHV